MLAAGTGIVLLFFTFNLFVLPIAQELGATRGEVGTIQALIVTAALGSVVIGRAADRFGFRQVYVACALTSAAIMLLQARFANSLVEMAIGVAVLGFVGIGTSAVVITRPINAHFTRYRGRALGIVAIGVSITTMIVPPLLQDVLDQHGWRGGFVALAGLIVLVGIPAVLLLFPASANRAAVSAGPREPTDWSFLRHRDFRLMTASLVVMGMATAGFVGQLSPVIQEEGLSAATGALALSVFAAGQFAGRLGGGWLLDKFEPRRVAVVMTLAPGSGFLLLLGADQSQWAAVLAAGMIGLQQGAELDVFAYFTGRRFPVTQYGTIYGALHGFSWLGNAIGIASIGLLHDRLGSYDFSQGLAMAGLAIGALLIWLVRLPPVQPIAASRAVEG
jgi:MFS family permease